MVWKLEELDDGLEFENNNIMFNYDNFNSLNNYAGRYCNNYPPNCQHDPYKSQESCFQPQQFFIPPLPPFAFPHCSPFDLEEIKYPTVSRDCEMQEEQGLGVAVVKVKAEEKSELQQVKLEQKYGRNIASNIFHSIIRWVSLEPSFNTLIHTLILKHKLKISYCGFKQKAREMGEKLKGYVNAKTMRALFLGRRIGATWQDKDFSKLMRILGRIYLQQYHFCHVYCSPKIRKKSRFLHIKRMRLVMKLIK